MINKMMGVVMSKMPVKQYLTSFAVAELEALLAERGLALDYQLFHQTDQVGAV